MAKPKPDRDFEILVYEAKPSIHHFPGDFTFEIKEDTGHLLVLSQTKKVVAIFTEGNWAAVIKSKLVNGE